MARMEQEETGSFRSSVISAQPAGEGPAGRLGQSSQGAQDAADAKVSPHDAQAYLPEKSGERRGIALCLSGGGFRAALFHLGALRRLNEMGVLSKVDAISSVSGGSVLSAFLAEHLQPWPQAGEIVPEEEWDRLIAEPFRAFASKNLRTVPLLKGALPWNFFFRPSTAIEAVEARYAASITSLSLRQLPERPRFLFSAAELSYGVNWVFSKERVGDYAVGYLKPAPDWPVAYAVAASSCFPPVFNPIPVRKEFTEGRPTGGAARHDSRYEKALCTLGLSDGGGYDNLGLEPVWKTSQTVLVSDGGAVFDPDWDKGIIWRLSRYMRVLGNQVTAIRKRWLVSSFIAHNLDTEGTNPYAMQGTYWGIGTSADRYKRPAVPNAPKEPAPRGYTKEVVKGSIAPIRTDFDAFTEAERCVLENHGYLLAEAAIHRYLPDLVQPGAREAREPFPGWMDEAKVTRELQDSGVVKLLGRW